VPTAITPPHSNLLLAISVNSIWADLDALVLAAFALSILFIMHAFWKEETLRRSRCRWPGFVLPIRAAPPAAAELNRPSTEAGRIRVA